MMYRVLLVILGTSALMSPQSASGQNIETLVDTLLQRNLQLQYYQSHYQASLERVGQVGYLPDPEFGIGAFVLPVETRLGAQVIRLSGTQMTPWFGTLQAKEDLAAATAEAEYQPLRVDALELIFQLKMAYFDLYEIARSSEIIRQRIDFLGVRRQSLLGNIESGKGSAADVLRLDIKIRELEQEITILQNERLKPLADINRLLDREARSEITVTDSLGLAVLPYQTDTLENFVKAQHPAIKLYSLKQEQAQKSIQLNDKQRKPSIGVGADYIFVSSRVDAEPERNGRDILQLRAVVSVPIYGDKFNAREREEQLRIEGYDKLKQNAALQFRAGIDKALVDHGNAVLRLELYSGQVENLRAARRIIEQDYSANGDKFDELLQLEVELIEYDLKILNAIVSSHRALAALEKFTEYIN